MLSEFLNSFLISWIIGFMVVAVSVFLIGGLCLIVLELFPDKSKERSATELLRGKK